MSFARFAARAIALGLFFSAPFVQAQAPGPAQGPMRYDSLPPEHKKQFDEWYRNFDTDGDGSVSRDEYRQAQDNNFTNADASGDGKLSKDETLDFMARREAARASSGGGQQSR